MKKRASRGIENKGEFSSFQKQDARAIQNLIASTTRWLDFLTNTVLAREETLLGSKSPWLAGNWSRCPLPSFRCPFLPFSLAGALITVHACNIPGHIRLSSHPPRDSRAVTQQLLLDPCTKPNALLKRQLHLRLTPCAARNLLTRWVIPGG